ncbi:hypothetical protein G7K71_16225 [Desulfofundulus sp. TPOSR]|uniref:hypothetical protein n=1 Tax=Desulfofundulus sp. TPOSR TaxID=2714340 RepID=UPI00140C223D|nr:hypothetical protein [Desulfofundulus sp. TPOSR]NHM28487.1 hypothetical protein [Desulfofundulus sp. TPOSR]
MLVKKDLHITGDELRQRFCEVRDEKARAGDSAGFSSALPAPRGKKTAGPTF